MVFIGAPLCRRLFPRGLAPPGQKSRHVIAEAYHAAAVVAFLVMIYARRLRRRGGVERRSHGHRGEMRLLRPGTVRMARLRTLDVAGILAGVRLMMIVTGPVLRLVPSRPLAVTGGFSFVPAVLRPAAAAAVAFLKG
jgi:hypothetical protein